MKRLSVLCFLLSTLLNVICGMALSEPSLDSQLLSCFYQLWEDSAFGKDPNRTERAAWILRQGASEYSLLRWPTSRERNKEYWRGPLPENTVAQVHIHTSVADPKPARKDIELCKKIGLPIFVVSGDGIWAAYPDGKIEQVYNSTWYRKFRRMGQK